RGTDRDVADEAAGAAERAAEDHAWVVAQLGLEVALRKDASGRTGAAVARRADLSDAVSRKRAFLDGLRARVAAVGDAAAPLYASFGRPPERVGEAVRRLPPPLYTLYATVSAYIRTVDDSFGVRIAGSGGP